LPYVIALAAGALLYIATADILPGLHKERDYKKIIAQTISFILGALIIYFIIGAFPE
jgi:zinc and cadmium transporter